MTKKGGYVNPSGSSRTVHGGPRHPKGGPRGRRSGEWREGARVMEWLMQKRRRGECAMQWATCEMLAMTEW